MAWDKFTDLQAPGAVPDEVWKQIQDAKQAYIASQNGPGNHYYSGPTTFMGPDGVMYQMTTGGGWQDQGEAGRVWTGDPTFGGVYAVDPNHYTNGDTYWQFDPNTGKFLNKGQFDSGKWSLGDVLDGVKFVGGAALGMNALTGLAGMGGAASGAGTAGAGGATAGGLDSAGGVLNNAVMSGGAGGAGGAAASGAGAAGATQAMGAAGAGSIAPTAAGAADGGWGLTNAVVNGGAGTDLTGLATAGTGATVLPAATAGNGLLDALGGAKALVGPAASLIGGAYAANAAKDAAASQAASADKALGLQKDMFDKVISLNEPFREGGVAGMNALQVALGLKPGDNSGWAMKDFTPSDLTTDPSYQWRLNQGLDALDRASAAHGRFDSGRTMKDITNYAQGAASQEYGNAFNRFQTQRAAKLAPLQSLAGVGQTAAGTAGNAAQNYGSNAANLITGAGNANAAGTVGSANAWTNAIGQGLSSYQNNNLMDLLLKREQNRTGATNGY